MERRVVFSGWLFPALLLLPQLAVTLVFFFWPAAQAILQSVRREDAFGLSTRFVGAENFTAVLGDPFYLASAETTLLFSIAVAVLALGAGLQSIPASLLEASAIDGASPRRRFWTIVFPLLAPTSFFLLVVNIVYAFFDTFGVIHNVTQGGPAKATEILVYKVWYDGMVGLD